MSGLWQSLKEDTRVLKTAPPGTRFQTYKQHQLEQAKTEGPWRRAAHFAIAFALIVIGLAIGWLPGPGGFIALIGVAMLVPLVPGAPQWMDKGELMGRQLFKRLRHGLGKQSHGRTE